MPQTRHISGEIIFPPNAAAGVTARLLVEVRDVSMQDQASIVLASTVLHNVAVGPGVRVPFDLMCPTAERGRSLSIRVEVDMDRNRSSTAGGFLSTVAIPVPASGDVKAVLAPVTKL